MKYTLVVNKTAGYQNNLHCFRIRFKKNHFEKQHSGTCLSGILCTRTHPPTRTTTAPHSHHSNSPTHSLCFIFTQPLPLYLILSAIDF